jgi:uncharacterized protein YkwD
MRISIFIFFLFVILIGSSFKGQMPESTGSKISTSDAQRILDHHNQVRRQKGVPPLIWNAKLSAYAQKWADYLANSNHCSIKHRTDCGEDGNVYGENIFWGSSAAFYHPLDASTSWYDEKKDYRYRTIDPNDWHETGHYTQMIWKDTREMGVGVAICPDGAIIVVANYYPAGNVIGRYPY